MPDLQRASLLAERGVTRREAEVLVAVTERLTNARIAERLYLSERTVESHVSSLLRKLDAANRVELGDLAKEILTGLDPCPAPPLPAPLQLLADPERFVGRDPEMGELRSLWCRAEEGLFLVAVVEGAAGIGKSRLVAELAAEIRGAGARVLLGTCFENVRVPYEPFVQAIRADAAMLTLHEARRRDHGAADPLEWLIPELSKFSEANLFARRDADRDPATTQVGVYEALHSYMVTAAQTGAILLVIEDLHWATSTTLGALGYMARMSGHTPVLVVVTTRVDPPDLDADLPPFLADLCALPAVKRIVLAGLSEAEGAASFGVFDNHGDADSVRAETGGNPLLVREAFAGGRTGSLGTLLSSRYAEALEGLDDNQSGPDLARHVAIGAVLGDASSATLTSANGKLVDRVRRSLRESGDRATALNDLTAARCSYEKALDLWPRGDPERPSLLLDLGRTLLTLESQGEDVLGEARDGLLALGDVEQAAEAEMMLGELDWISSRWYDAETHFERAAALVADHAATRATARVLAGLARFRMIGGANRQAHRYGTRALEMARTLGLRTLEANVLHTLGPARVNDGDLGGIDDLKAGIELAETLGSPEAETRLHEPLLRLRDPW